MWLERSETQTQSATVDVHFKLECAQLPVEHAEPLAQALAFHLPWLEKAAAIHSLGASGGNGWSPPEGRINQVLALPRRTRLRLRVPRARAAELTQLNGIGLDIAGYALKLLDAHVRELVPEPTLFARRIVVHDAHDEAALLEAAIAHLAELDIEASKLLCGRAGEVKLTAGTLTTRALMVAELLPHESLRLQDAGFGHYQHLGCGVFVPHKNIAPV